MEKVSFWCRRCSKTAWVAMGVWLWAVSAPAMTPEEAGRLIGAEDPFVAQQAQDALLAAGSVALPVLAEICFSKDERVAERAKVCRRRILHAIPVGVPPELEEGILKFHRQDAEKREQVIGQIRKNPKLGARTLAQLYSRVLEHDRGDPSLQDIGRAFRQMQGNSDARVQLSGFDPMLLDVRARALVVDSIDQVRHEDIAIYQKWFDLDPAIRDWYEDGGIGLEAKRLRVGKSVVEAIAALADLKNERLRRKVGACMFPEVDLEISGWQNCPAALRLTALEMAHARDPGKAQKIYREFLTEEPALAGRLPAGLIGLEVRRMLDAGQIPEACRIACGEEASQGLMRIIGEEARMRPEAFVEGFPNPAGMTERQMAEFLDGLAQECRRDLQDEWWNWVEKVRALSGRSPAQGVWREAMMRGNRYEYLMPLAAVTQELPVVIERAAQDAKDGPSLILTVLFRREPALVQQVKATDRNAKLLQSVLDMLLGMQAGLADLRLANQMLATWSVSRPEFQPVEMTGIYQPLAAIRDWDAGDRTGCIRQLNEMGNQASATRVMIDLLVTVPPDIAIDLARSIQLPKVTLPIWIDAASAMDDQGSTRVCDLLDRLDEQGLLNGQMQPIHSAKLKQSLWRWFLDGRKQRVNRLVDTCYWFLDTERWQDVCGFAELMRMEHGAEWVQSRSATPRALRRPMQRLVLLRAIGRNDEVASLIDILGESEFKERVLLEQGRHVDAVKASIKRRKGPYNDLQMSDALVFEPDCKGKYKEARDVMRERRGSSVQECLQWLEGFGVENLAVHAINDFQGRLVIEYGALEPLIFHALESRALAAVRGDSEIEQSTMAHYINLAPWMPDRARTLEVLRRWAEIPPEKMPDIIGRKDSHISFMVIRGLLACGEIERGRARLNELVQFKGGVDRLSQSDVGSLCGWNLGQSWKGSLAWRMMRLEYPDLEDAEVLLQLALSSQVLSMESGINRLGELLSKHASSFSRDEQRRLIMSWADDRTQPVLDPQGDLPQWLAQLKVSMANPLPMNHRSIEMEYIRAAKPDELLKRSTRKDRTPLATGVAAMGDAWHAGRQDEARTILRRLMWTLILDGELEGSISHDYKLVRGKRSYGVGESYSPAEHIVWQAHLNRLSDELLHDEVDAMCRMTHEVSGDALERVGMVEQALAQRRLESARLFGGRWGSLSHNDIDRAATLRRLECKLAMRRGHREEVLAAVKRFLPMDPYHRAFLLAVRDWFTARGDAAGVQEVDRMVLGFWKDRLMWLPGFRSYQLELSQWLLATAQPGAR